jgi:hypothetical protein
MPNIYHTNKGKIPKKEATTRQDERIKIKKMQEQLEKSLKENGIKFTKK